jgi:hypothetical protein
MPQLINAITDGTIEAKVLKLLTKSECARLRSFSLLASGHFMWQCLRLLVATNC